MPYLWNRQSNPFGNDGIVYGVCWSPDLSLFVAVGADNGNTISLCISPDGYDWTAKVCGLDGGEGKDVAWSPALGLFVATGFNSGSTVTIVTSTDGDTWTNRANGLVGGYGNGVDWSPSLGQFVVVGQFGTLSTISSTNGTAWTNETSNLRTGWGVYWSSDLALWVATGANAAHTKYLFTSTNGTAWTDQTTGMDTDLGQYCYTAFYSPTLSLLMAGSNDYPTNSVMTSTDHVVWSPATAPPNGWVKGFAEGPNGLVAVGFDFDTDSTFFTSDDGLTWTDDPVLTDFADAESVVYSPDLDLFVAVGNGFDNSYATIMVGLWYDPLSPAVTTSASPLWRWLVTDLSGASLTLLDHLATERMITPKLNEPLEVTGTVPSDNVAVNRLVTADLLPYMAEGARQLYCFRQEYNALTSEYQFNIRASTLILQTTDAAAQDDARTRFTAWDPFQYLFYQPVLIVIGGEFPVTEVLPRQGITYNDGDNATTYDALIITWLDNALSLSFLASLYIDWGQTIFYTGTIETCFAVSNYHVDPGTNLGQAIQDICAAGYCDVWFEPIYDPVNRPGILCQLSIFAQQTDTVGGQTGGLGDFQYSAIFSWDGPGHSLVGANNLYDGTMRANIVQFYSGQGGNPVTQFSDPDSQAIYNDYWAMQFFPAQHVLDVPVESIAKEQLALRSFYKETLTVNPAPERAPQPFVDYNLGDRVPVYVTINMRQPLPPYWDGPWGDPDIVWQRVFGIPIELDDNGTETVRELICGPIGAAAPPIPGPGPIAPPDAGPAGGGGLGLSAAVKASGTLSVTTVRRVRNRGGRLV